MTEAKLQNPELNKKMKYETPNEPRYQSRVLVSENKESQHSVPPSQQTGRTIGSLNRRFENQANLDDNVAMESSLAEPAANPLLDTSQPSMNDQEEHKYEQAEEDIISQGSRGGARQLAKHIVPNTNKKLTRRQKQGIPLGAVKEEGEDSEVEQIQPKKKPGQKK